MQEVAQRDYQLLKKDLDEMCADHVSKLFTDITEEFPTLLLAS